MAPKVTLTSEEQSELARIVTSRLSSVRLSQRAQMVLLAADGLQNKEITDRLGVDRMQVARWRQRYLEHRLAGIERDLPRGPPPVKVDVARLVELTTQSKPEAVTHWSTRSMAAELGVSASAFRGIGARTASSPIWCGVSRFRAIPGLSRSWNISWVCICPHRSTLWCSAWMRKARYRHWTAPNRDYR